MDTSNSIYTFDRWMGSWNDFIWSAIVRHDDCHFKHQNWSWDGEVIRNRSEVSFFLWFLKGCGVLHQNMHVPVESSYKYVSYGLNTCLLIQINKYTQNPQSLLPQLWQIWEKDMKVGGKEEHEQVRTRLWLPSHSAGGGSLPLVLCNHLRIKDIFMGGYLPLHLDSK
jgi:hypothetical protein